MINTTLPEIILLDTIKSALAFVRNDFASNTDKTKTYLYLLLNGASLEKYDMFEQAVEVICGAEDSPRLFEIDLAFNMKRDKVPVAHITLPSEMTGAGNGMGTDEGYADDIYDIVNLELNPNGISTQRAVLSRRLSATYNIVIMSDNTNEVILIYHFLRAILIALIPHLHIKGLSNISFGGQDLQPYEGITPEIHMRAITLNLQYDTFVPSIFPTDLISKLIVGGVPTN